MTTLFLPFPPSTNTLFPGIKRRHKSAKYKEWIKAASQQLNAQRLLEDNRGIHTGKVDIAIALTLPNKRSRDIDNHSKAILDLLVSERVIQDDNHNYVASLHIWWNYHDASYECLVAIDDVEDLI